MFDKKRLNAKVKAEIKNGEAITSIEGNGAAVLMCFEALACNIIVHYIESMQQTRMTEEEVVNGMKGAVEMAYKRARKGKYKKEEDLK